MPQVKIYSTSWCAFCRAEKQFLDQHQVTYEDVDVEKDAAAAAEMMQLSGQTGVPFTVITAEGGQQLGILGFDRPKLAAALGLK